MTELFLMRWPKNISATYVNGATLRFNKNQSVYYANEMLSPGQIICMWKSSSDYLSSGNVPTLPLLSLNKEYDLSFKLEADNDLAVQIQIDFFDDEHEIIQRFMSTDFCLNFIVPSGMVEYEIHLINLKHKWINFDYLMINEAQENEFIVEKNFSQHYDWIYPRTSGKFTNKKAHIILNSGPRTILPISFQKDVPYNQIFVFTNGKDLEELVNDLTIEFQVNREYQLNMVAGMGFYTIPSEAIEKIKQDLNSSKMKRR